MFVGLRSCGAENTPLCGPPARDTNVWSHSVTRTKAVAEFQYQKRRKCQQRTELWCESLICIERFFELHEWEAFWSESANFAQLFAILIFLCAAFQIKVNILGAFVGLDRGSKFSITDILERDTNDASLDATVETRRENKEKEKNLLGQKAYAM